ncbi:MAG: SocA family protein [Bacteroidetes bacterium]|nr:SocA family protein [Bacteroidota bacterium]
MPISGVNRRYKGYTKQQVEKMGHAIIYLANGMGMLYKTKLLKLVYLLDEISVSRQGIPFFDLEYKVWQAGPVSVDLYEEFNEHPFMLESFIDLKFDEKGTRIIPKIAFCDDEFSPMEIDLLREIVDTYKWTSAEKLVELVHRKESPWYTMADQHDLLEVFDSRSLNTTDLTIDLSLLIKNDPVKLALFNENKEIANFSRPLKH